MQRAAIFCLRSRGKVEVSHRVPSYHLDAPSDALENQFGPLVWALECFEVIKFKPLKLEISEIG